MTMFSRILAALAVASTMIGMVTSEEEIPNFLGVFKTSVFMALEWEITETTPSPEYPSDEVFAIENGATRYFTALLSDNVLSAFQSPNEFVDASVAVRRQLTAVNAMIIETTIDVYHVGDSGIADLADLLRFVTNQNNTGNANFETLNSLIGLDDVNVDQVSFSNAVESTALVGGFDPLYLTKDIQTNEPRGRKGLVVVTVILTFALFAVSVILVWVAGGWLEVRRQVEILLHREDERTRMALPAIEAKGTHDTEEEPSSPPKDDGTQLTNASGLLGVNPYYKNKSSNALDGLGIKMTPARTERPDMDSEMGTPMSEFSDTGRAPIGITSMRKLLVNRGDAPAPDYSMKRLEYNED